MIMLIKVFSCTILCPIQCFTVYNNNMSDLMYSSNIVPITYSSQVHKLQWLWMFLILFDIMY